jgi:hypothetical protein
MFPKRNWFKDKKERREKVSGTRFELCSKGPFQSVALKRELLAVLIAGGSYHNTFLNNEILF